MNTSAKKNQASVDLDAHPNSLELVGVYKFTRNQANMRRRDQADIPPALSSQHVSAERLVSGTYDEYQTIDPSAKRKEEQAVMYQ